MALLAETLMEKVPESEEKIPFCWPRIVMETEVKGCSFSSIIFPLIVAPFFCAKEMAERKKVMIRIGSRKFTKQILAKVSTDDTDWIDYHGFFLAQMTRIVLINTDFFSTDDTDCID